MSKITHLKDGGITVEMDMNKPAEPLDMTWEQWLKAIGGRNLGASQVEPNRRGNSRSQDDGVKYEP